MKILPWIVLASLGLSGAALAQETTVRIGMARSTSNAAELMATTKGYFKEEGIKVALLEPNDPSVCCLDNLTMSIANSLRMSPRSLVPARSTLASRP